MAVRVAPLADMAVVIEAPVLPFVIAALLVFVGMLEVVVNLHALEVTVVEFTAAVSSLAVPMHCPQQVVVMMATL